MLPNTFIIGATKAGTTSLCRLLAAHPQIYFSPHKEPQYFSVPHRFERGIDWYTSLFEGATDEPIVAEGSTTYSWLGIYPHTLERMLAICPEPRIIYAVRDPLRRLESQWIQLRHMGYGVHSRFATSMRDDPMMIDSALYKKQIDAYRQAIRDERIHIAFFEDFIVDPVAEVQRCFAFLGVDPDFVPPEADKPSNSWQEKRNDRAVMNLLRRIPGYDLVRDHVIPRSIRRTMKPAVTRPVQDRPQWDASTRNWVLDQITHDVTEFLQRYGKPHDFWDLGHRSDSELTPSTAGIS